MKKSWILLAVFALLGTFAAYAQTESAEPAELQTQTQALDKTALSLGEEKTLQMLSQQLGISSDTLALQRQQTNLGFGQLFVANSLATSLQAANPEKNFDAIVQQFQSGTGWGAIAKENGLTLGKVVSQMKRSNTAMERERQNQVRASEARKTGSGSASKAGQTRQNTGRRGGNATGRGRN